MSSFIQKRITRGQTLADSLRRVRLEKKYTLSEASEAIGVQLKYLEYFESGEYQKLPGDMYARAWLKLYADFLEIPADSLLRDYKLEKVVSDKLKKVEASHTRTRFNPLKMIRPISIKAGVVLGIIIAAFIYLGWEVKNIIAAPQIVINEPGDNYRTSESAVLVKGSTEPEVQLTINNEPVLLDESGNFEQVINLVSGLNNLSISAKKKHSKVSQYEMIILREGNNQIN